MHSTPELILHLLKKNGPQTAEMLGDALSMTSMGARRHLHALGKAGQLESFDKSEGVGRPRQFWRLTAAGHARFGDAHAELTAKMIGDVRRLFGEEGLAKLVAERERDMRMSYEKAMTGAASLAARVEALATVRAAEGYMARVERDGEDFILIEDHCPICAAASACQGFCRSELALFRMMLGEGARIEREEYLLDGGRRCTYRIEKTE
ncbi:MAG: transcriptional regulator [Parvibaculum sp.]|uniref:helix-turn-helix transcriptional regulator n=1 Tax=Parvibaculum sp. TaxID=2024848 RepID=UPI0032EB7C64